MECDTLTLNGNAQTVSLQLSYFGIELNPSEAAELLDYIASHKSLLEAGEKFDRKILYSTLTKGRKRDVYYYVNVKAITFALAVWLSGKFEERLEELLFGILYVPPERIVKLDEDGGEVCLTKQAVLNNGRCATREIFVKNNGICVNPELCCKFKDGELCACKKSDADDIIDGLVKKNVFLQAPQKYKFNW